jgi:hypothetical protein
VGPKTSQLLEGLPSQEEEVVVCNAVLNGFPLAFQDLGNLQRQDPELEKITVRLEKGEGVPGYSLSRDVLCWVPSRGGGQKIVVPTAAVHMICEYFHTSPVGGHLGIYKSISKIRENFAWKNMYQEIRDWVLRCQACARSKPAQSSRVGLLASEVAQRPFKKLFIDYVGKLPRTKQGNCMLLVCVDDFSKFVWLVPVRRATTEATIKALRTKIFSSFSVPEITVSDNAQCFVSKEFRQFCFGLEIQHVTTTPYYPQPSLAERFNRNLPSALIAYHAKSQNTWDVNLDWLQIAFNLLLMSQLVKLLSRLFSRLERGPPC